MDNTNANAGDRKLSLQEIELSSFVTMLDEDQQNHLAGGFSSAAYHTCISALSNGTGFCHSTFSFDGPC